MILDARRVQEFRVIAYLAAQAVQDDEEDEVERGNFQDKVLDPVMSTLMENPARAGTLSVDGQSLQRLDFFISLFTSRFTVPTKNKMLHARPNEKKKA